MPIYLDDPNNPCNSLSNYGAPIKLQSYYPSSPYQQYQQAAASQQSGQMQYSSAPMYQTQAPQAQPPAPISPPGYWPQTTQPVTTQAHPPPRNIISNLFCFFYLKIRVFFILSCRNSACRACCSYYDCSSSSSTTIFSNVHLYGYFSFTILSRY